jgi:hypothetical protein
MTGKERRGRFEEPQCALRAAPRFVGLVAALQCVDIARK